MAFRHAFDEALEEPVGGGVEAEHGRRLLADKVQAVRPVVGPRRVGRVGVELKDDAGHAVGETAKLGFALAQRLLGLPLAGDVAQDRLRGVLPVVLDGHRVGLNDPPLPVEPLDLVLHRGRGLAVLDLLDARLVGLGGPVVRREVEDRAPDDLRRRAGAEELRPGGVDVLDGSVDGDLNGVAVRLDEALPALAVAAQLLFYLLALGDVHHSAVHVLHAPVGILHRGRAQQAPEGASVGPAQANLFIAEVLPARLLEDVVPLFGVGVEDRQVVQREHGLRAVVAEKFDEGVVHVHQPLARHAAVDALGDVVVDGGQEGLAFVQVALGLLPARDVQQHAVPHGVAVARLGRGEPLDPDRLVGRLLKRHLEAPVRAVAHRRVHRSAEAVAVALGDARGKAGAEVVRSGVHAQDGGRLVAHEVKAVVPFGAGVELEDDAGHAVGKAAHSRLALAQRFDVLVALDGQARQGLHLAQKRPVAVGGTRRRCAVHGERPQHGVAGAFDGHRPAGPQVVRARQVAEPLPPRIGRDVFRNHRVAAVNRCTARPRVGSDGRPVDGLDVRVGQVGSGCVAQAPGVRVVEHDGGVHVREPRLDGVHKILKDVGQRHGARHLLHGARLKVLPRLGVLALGGLAAQLQLVDDHRRQVFQLLNLAGRWRGCARARCRVQDAQRAQDLPARRHQRGACVEPHARLASHQRVFGEARIICRVLHHQRLLAPNGVGTERGLKPQLVGVQLDVVSLQPDAGLKPLAVGPQKADQRGLRVEEVRRHVGNAVEGRLRRGVENGVAAQGRLALRIMQDACVRRRGLPRRERGSRTLHRRGGSTRRVVGALSSALARQRRSAGRAVHARESRWCRSVMLRGDAAG